MMLGGENALGIEHIGQVHIADILNLSGYLLACVNAGASFTDNGVGFFFVHSVSPFLQLPRRLAAACIASTAASEACISAIAF